MCHCLYYCWDITICSSSERQTLASRWQQMLQYQCHMQGSCNTYSSNNCCRNIWQACLRTRGNKQATIERLQAVVKKISYEKNMVFNRKQLHYSAIKCKR